MAVQLIQATTIKSSKTPIELEDGCHLKKIKGMFYLIKTHSIEIDYPIKNHKNERKTKTN
jgi:hypothetical protein